MQEFSATPGDGTTTSAGLVLLYADGHSELPAAWLLPADRPTVVGSGSDASLRLPVFAVSRVHAKIERRRGQWHLEDQGSRNGTLVDGHRVASSPLEHGQELRFGDAIVKFVERDAEEYGRYELGGSMTPGQQRLSQSHGGLIGGYQMDHIAAQIERVARGQPTPLSVLLLGESGTGKEVVAQSLHRQSGRRGAFRAVNCAALPQNLVESELFGYKRGAFSGANRDKPGIIRSAHGGTLLLDEIGDMPLEAQAKLLRVLQNRELVPLGATEPEPVDVRVIGATHRNLDQLLEERRFRRDLYARLNEFTLTLPPLRDRKEDVYVLLREFFRRHGGEHLDVTFQFMTALLHYDWPYNVRELESCAKRCIVLSHGEPVDEQMLPEDVLRDMDDYGQTRFPTGDESNEPRAAPNREELVQLLERHQGNVAAVGRELGKARMQVHRWLKRYALDVSDYRP